MVTVIELNAKCKKLGLKGYTRLSKANLLKLVAKHETKINKKEIAKKNFKKNEELQIIQALSNNRAIQRKTLYNKVNLNEAQFGRTLHRLIQKEEVEAIKKYKPHPSGRGLSREYKMTYRLGWKLRKPKTVVEVLKSPGIKMREKFEFDKYGELRKAQKEKCWKSGCNKNAVYKRIVERNPLPICQSCYDDEKRRLGFAAVRAYVTIKEYDQWVKSKTKPQEQFEIDKHDELRKARKVKPRVKLVGTDRNAFAIIARVRKALMRAGLYDEADKFVKEATSGDYDNVIRSAMKYVDVY